MNLTAQFKEFLLNQNDTPSKVTVKNYISDLNRFINWFSLKFNKEFSPSEIDLGVIEVFKKELLTTHSASSIERNVSTLRKFFNFLKLEGQISHSPFELAVSNQKSEVDAWHLHEFKNNLYVFNASHLTIKNYIIDVKQFINWAQQALQDPGSWETSDVSLLSRITPDVIEEYKKRLLNQMDLSPVSVNRKLSSLRKYFSWAASEGLLKQQVMISNNPRLPVFGSRLSESSLSVNRLTGEQKTEKPLAENRKLITDNGYSKFPPFRLLQKAKSGLTKIFDGIFIYPLVELKEKIDLFLWESKGKPVFTEIKNQKSKIKNSKIGNWKLKIENYPKEFYAPTKISTANFPFHKKIIHHLRHTRPYWYKRYQSYTIVPYFHITILMLLVSVLGYAIYSNINPDKPQPKTLAALPTAPPRILSFQGRLTDAQGNPITSQTPLRMTIYNSSSATGSALLWQEVISPVPDEDGIFNVILGKGTAIPQSLFAENSALFLGVTVGQTPELKPRQQIATVAFAANAESLQGLLPITATSATSNVILALNSSGNLTIGGTASPVFQATGGAFTVSGKTLVLNTNTGTNGDVQIIPDGTGGVDIQKAIKNTSNNGKIIQGAVEVHDLFVVLATSSSQAAFNIHQNGTNNLITASVSGITRFFVGNSGAIYSGGNLEIDGGSSDIAGTLNLSGSSLTSTDNLTISATGYTRIADTATPTNASGDDDLFVESDLEVDGVIYAEGTIDTQFTGDNAAIYGTTSTGVLSSATTSTTGLCLVSGATTPSWANCNSSGIDTFWNQTSGALHPNNSTVDFLVGGQATASAKFSVLNINSGTPTASISANSGNIATYLTGDGNLQTTNSQALTLGGASTGNITLSPNNGSGGIVNVNSPTINTNATTLALFNTTATTINFAGAATTLSISASSGTTTINNALAVTGITTLTGNLNANGGLDVDDAFVIADGGKVSTIDISDTQIELTGTNTVFNATGDITLTAGGGNIISGSPINIGHASLTAAAYNYFADAITGNTNAVGDNDLYIQDVLEVDGVIYAEGTIDTQFTGDNAAIYGTTSTGVLSSATTSTTGLCLVSGATTPSWANCNSSGIDTFWNQTSGALFANNSTVDFLIGGQASTSAKFSVLNINSGTPTASVSSGTQGLALRGDGVIQSVRNNSLTLGGDTTGNIVISPLNGGAGSTLTANTINLTLSGTTTITGTSLTSITGGATAIDFTEFDVSASTGSITINDGGDAGNISIEGTVLDINSLDFTGAGTLTSGAGTNITFTPGTTGDLVFSTDSDTTATFNGSAEGTANVTLTAGDLTITDGDLTLSGGEISATADDTTGTSFSFTGVNTTGDTLGVVANSLTSGTALALSSTATSFNGELLTLNKTGASGSTAFTSDIANITYSQTFNGGVGLNSTGNVLDVSRAITLNNTGNTHTISGALVSITDSGTETAGDINNTSNLLSLSQNCGTGVTCSGAVLKIANSGTGADLALDNDETITNSTDGTIAFGADKLTLTSTAAVSGTLFTSSYASSTTQTGGLTGISFDTSTNVTVPNSSSGNQTGLALTVKDGGASATAIGTSISGTADRGIDLSGVTISSGGSIIYNDTSSTIDLAAVADNVLEITNSSGTTSNDNLITLEVDANTDASDKILLRVVSEVGGSEQTKFSVDSDGDVVAGSITIVTDLTCTDCLDFTDFEDTLDLDANLILNQTTSTWNQTFTGDTTVGLTYTANSLTTGTALRLTSSGTITSGGELLDLVGNSTTTGNLITASGTALTSGSVLSATGPSGGTVGITGNLVSLTSDVGNAGRMLSSTATIDSTAGSASGYNIYASTTNSNATNANSIYGVYSTLSDAVALPNTDYGIYSTVSNTAANTLGTKTVYGLYGTASNTSTGVGGSAVTYGGYFSSTGDSAGTSTAYGIYATASGADTNYAAIFENGFVGIGTTTPTNKLNVADTSTSNPRGISSDQFSNDTVGSQYSGRKSRGTTIGSHTLVQSGDVLGSFSGWGSDGDSFEVGASIALAVDGTPGASDMPGRIVFQTSADDTASLTERMRLANNGILGIGTTTANSQLHVTRPLSFGATGKALAIFDQIESQDLLTASASGTTRFTVANDGDITLNGGDTITASSLATFTTSATLGMASTTTLNCGDCIDFDDLKDTLSVDAATDINLGANALTIDLDSTGDFSIRDVTTDIATFGDVGSIAFAPTSGQSLTVTLGSTDLANVLTGNLKVGNGTPGVSQNGEDAYIEGTLEVDGTTTLDGALDSNGDVNIADTNIAFDGASTTFSMTGAASVFSVGDLTLDSSTDIILDADGADVFFKDATTTFATFTNSSTDLTLDIAGGQLLLADTDTFAIGGVAAGLAYNAISDSGGATSQGLASDDDLYIQGDLEVDGSTYFDGTVTTSSTASISGTLTLGGSSGTIRPATGNLSLQYKSGPNAWTNAITINTAGYVGIKNDGATEDLTIGSATDSSLGISTATSNRLYLTTFNDTAYLAINRRSSDGFFANSALGAASIGFVSDSTGGYIDFNTSSAANTNPSFRMRVAKDGTVGINTTSPTAQLDVAGAASVGGQLTFRSGTAAIQSTAGQTLTLGGTTTGVVNVNNKAGSSFVNFDTVNSRVGIGTTAPGTALHIGAGVTAGIPNGVNSDFTPQVLNSQTSGVGGIGVYINDGTNNRRAGLFVDQTNGVWGLSMTYSSGDIPFIINSGSQERLRIATDGDLTLTGGDTITASSLILFTGGATAIDFTEFDVSASTGSITINDGGNLGNISIEGTVLDINSLDFVGAGTLTTVGALTLTPSTTLTLNSTGDMTLDSSTDIILDADGADVILKDAGTTFATFTNSSTDLTLDIAGGQLLLADADTIAIGGVAAGLAYNAISDSGGATSQGLASDDDLYIQGDLEVDGSAYFDGAITAASTASISGNLTLAGGARSIQTTAGNTLTLGGTTTGLININNKSDSAFTTFDTVNSRVGIGTTAPDSKLDVAGRISQNPGAGITAYLHTNEAQLASTTALNPGILFFGPMAGTSGNYYGADLGYNGAYRTRIFSGVDIAFGTMTGVAPTAQSDFTELVTIKASGNLGIGDITPDAFLEVLGTTEQLRLTYTDGTVDSRFTVDSSGNLNIDNTGTKTTITDDLQITGNDILDSGAVSRITLGATTTLTNTTLTLSGTTTITGTSLTLITGGATAIDFTEFDVAAATGSITINDGGDAGNITIEGSVFDINSLDFVGAGTLTTVGALTLTPSTTLTLNSTGDMTLDSSTDIILDADGADWILKDAGTTIATFTNGSGDLSLALTDANGRINLNPGDSDNFVTLLGGAKLVAYSSDNAEYGLISHNGTDFLFETAGTNAGIADFNIGLMVDDAVTGKALVRLNETGDQDIFTASASGTTRFVIQNDGDVGIGIENPTLNAANKTVLHVNNDNAGYASAAHFTNGTTGSTATDGVLVGQWTDGNAYVWTYETSAMIFGVASAEQMRLTSTGLLSIGSTTGNSQLYVTRPLSKGVTGKALAIFDQIESQDIFTASASGTTRFSITNGGNVEWAGSELGTDQGGSIELGSSGTPFLDFSNDTSSDFDVRLILNGNDELGIQGATTLTPAGVTTITASSLTTLTTAATLAISGNITEGGSAVQSAADLDTCAEFAALGTIETGTCGSLVFSVSPTLTGTLTAAAITASGTITSNGAFDANGINTIGDNGDTVAIDSSDWNIDATGIMTGIGAITSNGLITTTAGLTVTGAAVSLNASSNFAVNIATGTSTGAVTIGGGSNTVAINSSDWDISTTGGMTGIGSIAMNGTLQMNESSATYDVWIVGINGAAGDTRNLALLGNETNDDLILNYNTEYDCVSVGGTSCTEALDVTGSGSFTTTLSVGTDLTVTGGDITGANGEAIDIGEAIDGRITLSANAATGYLQLGTNINSILETDSDLTLNVYNTSSTTDLIMYNSGLSSGIRVGVGTTTPASMFHVNGATTGKALVTLNETGNQNILVASASGSTVFTVARTGALTISGAATTAIDISSTSVTTDINLQNGETISNNTNGEVAVSGYLDALYFVTGGAWRFGESSTLPTSCEGANSLCFVRNTTNVAALSTGGNLSLAGVLNSSDANPDIAENIDVDDPSIEYGDIVVAETWNPNHENQYLRSIASKSSSKYQKNIIGVISEKPGILLNSGGMGVRDDAEDDKPIALAGRIKIKVTSQNGDIQVGDAITSSDIPGVGMKATQAGRVVGIALEPYSNSNTAEVQKIIVMLNPSFYDPDVQLADSGNLFIASSVQDLASSFRIQNTEYSILNTSNNEVIRRIGGYSEIVSAKIRAGIIEAQQLSVLSLKSSVASIGELSTDSLAVVTENITIAGTNIRDYIANIVDQRIAQNPSIGSGQANIISPIETEGENIIAKLPQNNSKLVVKNASGSAVAQIDSEGNASFSGKLKAENIDASEASISGTLRASTIVADDLILSEEALIKLGASISATSNQQLATSSAIANSQQQVASNSAVFDSLTVTQGLMSFGPTSFFEASIADRLFVGSQLSLADNAINVLGTSLEIQPLKQGGVRFLSGLVEIDREGNLKVDGNAYFAKDVEIQGRLLANILSPLPGKDLVVSLNAAKGLDSSASPQNDTGSKFVIQNSSQSGVLAVDAKGNLEASGSGTFAKLNLNFVPEALALSPSQVLATGSAGTAFVKANYFELTILNELVTEKSLIYITPVGQTQNQIYLLRQTTEDINLPGVQGSFTVGINQPVTTDTKFNYLIIN